MEQRISYHEFPAGLADGIIKTEIYLKKSGMDLELLEFVKLRASQINGCAYCIDMHFKEAKHLGIDDLRLYSLSVWKECPFYSDKEKIVLAFTEILTNTSGNEVEDDMYNELLKHFSKAEIALLTIAISQINVWNRINKTIKTIPGKYEIGRN